MIYHSKNSTEYADSYSTTDLDTEAKHTCMDIRDHLSDFDVIAVTGLSGILPAVPASLKLKVPLAILRKQDDDTHQFGGLRFTGDGSKWVGGECIAGKRVLWIDDFTCEGETRNRIKAAVTELGGEVVAEYLTRDREFTHWVDGEPNWAGA